MVAALLSHQIPYEIEEGEIRRLPIQLPDAVSRMGLYCRAESRPSPAARLLMDAIRLIAKKVKPAVNLKCLFRPGCSGGASCPPRKDCARI